MNELQKLIYDSLLFNEKPGDKKTRSIRKRAMNGDFIAQPVAIAVRLEARKFNLSFNDQEIAEICKEVQIYFRKKYGDIKK